MIDIMGFVRIATKTISIQLTNVPGLLKPGSFKVLSS